MNKKCLLLCMMLPFLTSCTKNGELNENLTLTGCVFLGALIFGAFSFSAVGFPAPWKIKSVEALYRLKKEIGFIAFFVLLLIAAFTTSITLYEPLITVAQEKLKFSRKKATFWVLFLTFILGNLPCILAYGPLRDVRILDKNIFDAFDFISGNIFFVLTALGAAIFVGWVLKDEAKKEAFYITGNIEDDGLYNALKHFEVID